MVLETRKSNRIKCESRIQTIVKFGIIKKCLHPRVYRLANTLAAYDNSSLMCDIFQAATQGSRCDYGLYFGASSTNTTMSAQLARQGAGLKMYLNETFTTLKLDDCGVWMKV